MAVMTDPGPGPGASHQQVLLEQRIGTLTDSQHPYNPDEPIHQYARARDVLAEALCLVIDDADTDPLDHDDPQVDLLAPSLRQLVMDHIQLADPDICKHMEHDINSLAANILEALPDTQCRALRDPPRD